MSKVWWLGWVAGVACLPGWCVQGLGQAVRAGHRPAHPAAAIGLPAGTVPAEAQAELTSMVARAGVIFAGHVLGIARSEGFVDVTFRIDEPVRGCNKLGVYVLREWAGLWSGEAARYRVGERLVMLLAARGPSGMSAPVGGDEGIIPIAATASEPLADASGIAPAEDGSAAADVNGMAADLRWVQVRAPRSLVYAAAAEAAASEDPAIPINRWGPVMPVAVSLGTPAGRPTVAAVLAVLRAAAGAGPGSGPGAGVGAGSGHEAR